MLGLVLNTEYITGSRTGAYRPTGFGQITLPCVANQPRKGERSQIVSSPPDKTRRKGLFVALAGPAAAAPAAGVVVASKAGPLVKHRLPKAAAAGGEEESSGEEEDSDESSDEDAKQEKPVRRLIKVLGITLGYPLPSRSVQVSSLARASEGGGAATETAAVEGRSELVEKEEELVEGRSGDNRVGASGT
mgnify:CR=1 FL=1